MKKLLFITMVLFCIKASAQTGGTTTTPVKTEAEIKAEAQKTAVLLAQEKESEKAKLNAKDRAKFEKYESKKALKRALKIAEHEDEVRLGKAVAGNRVNYSAHVLSTNFIIPMVRVNFLVNDPAAIENKKASVSLFNSVGAGVGYSWGKLERITSADGTVISQELTNRLGFQVGVLFAAGGGGSGTNTQTTTETDPSTSATSTTTVTNNQGATNIFALTATFSVLNFQFGGGYELGTLTPGHRRGFVTIAYSIPLSTLIKGGFWILKKKPVPSDNSDDSLRQ
ncbi:hypothetical protein [Mucilaginibacter sp. AK015]|uniref:hypothetical protein n=1 Tax=Mucilaginibacter sp. AK015 TaxID=2723072 RepID=UPI00160788F7|nr:hypothetical protein [Mucilaginibacter sp. AK015]MBB5394678.1 hypothetical protein [Mucilaginibacter sp. AK015]